MQDLKIGQAVEVSGLTTYEYDALENRVPRKALIYPIKAVITGKVTKQLGKYHRAHHDNQHWAASGEYEPAYLAVQQTVVVWAVRTGMMNKEHLIQDCDLKPINPFDLPNRGPKPLHKSYEPDPTNTAEGVSPFADLGLPAPDPLAPTWRPDHEASRHIDPDCDDSSTD